MNSNPVIPLHGSRGMAPRPHGPGSEMWTKRAGNRNMPSATKWAKTRTHRLERRYALEDVDRPVRLAHTRQRSPIAHLSFWERFYSAQLVKDPEVITLWTRWERLESNDVVKYQVWLWQHRGE